MPILTFSLALALAAPATDPREVLSHLEQSIGWYRHVEPLLRDRRTPAQAVQLAFDYARAEAALLGAAAAGGGGNRNIEQAAARANQRVTQLQAGLKDLDAAIEKAPARERNVLAARRRQMAAELEFARQVQQAVQGLLNFAGGLATDTAPAGLAGQIRRLERTVPEVLHAPRNAASAPAGQDAAAPESAGLFALGAELFTLARNGAQMEHAISETDALLREIDQRRGPLVQELRASVRRSESAAAAAGSEDPELMAMAEREIQSLTGRFKQLSAASLPLSEQAMLVESSRGGLLEARDGIGQRSGTVARYLLIRIVALAMAIGLVLVVSELWRRLTFRWVKDVRRRRQFLLLRRIVVGGAIGLAVVLGVVSEFGSVATYAGFLTAGLAVALQNVILSVVAYFFLIGRYGLKIGDRVTISGVTGEVIEIGLVRIYLMEMAGAGGDRHATGRIVVFSNAVMFQPAALFKQMPGTDYVWHTVTLTLAPESDFELAQKTLMAAVDGVYQEYRESIEQQHAAFERSVDIKVAPPRPDGRLRFAEGGLEFSVRYPAEMRRASSIDERMVKSLYEAIAAQPKLSLAAAGAPKRQEGA